MRSRSDVRSSTALKWMSRIYALENHRYLEEKPYVRAMVEFLDDNEEVEEDVTEVEQNVWTTLQDVLRLSNKLYESKQEFGEDLKRVAPGGAGLGAHAEARVESGKPALPWPTRHEPVASGAETLSDVPFP